MYRNIESLMDQELYLLWARGNIGRDVIEQEFARRILHQGGVEIDDDLFWCRFQRVPGSSRSRVVITPKEE